MRKSWEIYKFLAHRVMGSQHYPETILNDWEERQLFRQVMQEKPRDWTRLQQRYSEEQAYHHFKNVQQDMPQFVPQLWVFVGHCLLYLLFQTFCRPLDRDHGS